jgi:hypothetical protein
MAPEFGQVASEPAWMLPAFSPHTSLESRDLCHGGQLTSPVPADQEQPAGAGDVAPGIQTNIVSDGAVSVGDRAPRLRCVTHIRQRQEYLREPGVLSSGCRLGSVTASIRSCRMQGDQFELGSNAYLFRSPERSSKTILILAHGGRETERQFYVPADCTIHYHAMPNQSYRMRSDPLGDYQDFSVSQVPAFSRGPNTNALDMKLGKILGSHWDQWDAGTTDRGYRGLTDRMRAAHTSQSGRSYPHVVVIRNRNKALLHTTPYVWLSEIVARIRRSSVVSGPFDIHVRACLNDDEDIRRLRAGKQRFQNAPPARP